MTWKQLTVADLSKEMSKSLMPSLPSVAIEPIPSLLSACLEC